MSIYYSGTYKRSRGVLSAIIKQLNLVNLKPVKNIQVQFDPFHPKAVTARDFLFHITTPKVKATNLNCRIKTNIICDRSDPWIKVHLTESGYAVLPYFLLLNKALTSRDSITFEADNLTVLEILQQFNKRISSLVKPDEVTTFSTQLQKLKKKKLK
ncbi:hypothetical protein FQA39_LY08533 [Lamprigera yunnana]|nr:hypothetical protein FQA39_LY08533 [Lamprigera yunnana]